MTKEEVLEIIKRDRPESQLMIDLRSKSFGEPFFEKEIIKKKNLFDFLKKMEIATNEDLKEIYHADES